MSMSAPTQVGANSRNRSVTPPGEFTPVTPANPSITIKVMNEMKASGLILMREYQSAILF